MDNSSSQNRSLLLWIAVLILLLVHQDFWYWDDRTLIGGYLPIGLGFHMLFSIASAILWACAIRFAWPSRIEAMADEADSSS